MKAKEAKKQALNVIDGKINENYEKILQQIKHFVKGGCFEVMIYEDILPDVKEKLREDGYDVYEIPDGRNSIDHKISWEKA